IRDRYQITVEVLLCEAELALLASANALTEDHRNAVAGVIPDARTTYESIRAMRKELILSPNEASALDAKMDRLRATLRFLGERF
ncbi:MAG: hypothetical protein WCB76_07750, partial [Acidobacteriaceae bacterium]